MFLILNYDIILFMNTRHQTNDRRSKDARTDRLVFLAFCTAAGLACSYLETLVPLKIPVPGAKPGLPNIVTVTLLYCADAKAAIFVTLARIILSGFMFGNMFSIVYSLSGFLFSFLTMLALKKTGRFGMTGVSTAGGVMHNAGQLTAAALLTDGYVFSYLPALIAAGVAAGVVIGLLSGIIAGRLATVIGRMNRRTD